MKSFKFGIELMAILFLVEKYLLSNVVEYLNIYLVLLNLFVYYT